MTVIHPIALRGRWALGFSLDYHTISSTCVGYYPSGLPMYDTEYTEIGALLYRLKTQKDKSVVGEIVQTATGFVQSSYPPLSMIVPVPPSNLRPEQPVVILANGLGDQLKLPVRQDAVAKVKQTEQLKNIHDYGERVRILDGAFSSESSIVSGQTILLFDDLYRSGATMDNVAKVLREQGKAAEIYALTISRTRINR